MCGFEWRPFSTKRERHGKQEISCRCRGVWVLTATALGTDRTRHESGAETSRHAVPRATVESTLDSRVTRSAHPQGNAMSNDTNNDQTSNATMRYGMRAASVGRAKGLRFGPCTACIRLLTLRSPVERRSYNWSKRGASLRKEAPKGGCGLRVSSGRDRNRCLVGGRCLGDRQMAVTAVPE